MMDLKKGQRVKWVGDGSLGTVVWVTNRGGFFKVLWDDGESVEYTEDVMSLIDVVEV
ncbi:MULTISPECIES: hypothetical protein [Bacillus amyloliquefaciens group]|uniref:hypothetical protein n=1 Tax=Bacillus amyloliquefaciens group TaxID=1938374 RepID=UPI000AC09EEB|nr:MULTISPECIES: hypothetical protein [Bacillus amyloliquefaciens group]